MYLPGANRKVFVDLKNVLWFKLPFSSKANASDCETVMT